MLNLRTVPSILLATTFILLLTVQLGESLKCFQCNSYVNASCADVKREDTWSSFYQDCNESAALGNPVFCRKLTQTVKRTEGDHVRVIRKCSWEKSKKDCYKVNDDDHSEYVCQCFHDGCNSADFLGGPSTYLIPVVVLAPSALLYTLRASYV